jgi:hypothetical protein
MQPFIVVGDIYSLIVTPGMVANDMISTNESDYILDNFY